MKRIISAIITAATVISMASCGVSPERSSVTSSDGLEKYASWLGEKVGDRAKVFVGNADDAEKHGIDMTGFLPEGYIIRTEGDEVVIYGADEKGVDRAVHDYVHHIGEGYSRVYNEGHRVKKITLAGYDISEYAIVLEADASENEKFAAEQLVKYTEKACGVVIPVTTVHQAREIVFGDDPDGSLGDEGFTIKTTDGKLEIVCGNYRGALFGVMTFLEKYEGWRFVFDSVCESYAKAYIDYLYESDNVVIPVGIVDTQVPDFVYRDFWGGGTEWSGTEYSFKSKYNGAALLGNEKLGGHRCYNTACHGIHNSCMFWDILGEKEYGQLCFTDQEILDILLERYGSSVRAEVAAGKVIGDTLMEIDASQNDSSSFCMCKTCKKLYQENGGAQSAGVIYMGNFLAEELNKEFPGLIISLFAYYGSGNPPLKMELNENIKISYCWYVSDDGMASPCMAHCFSAKNCDPDSRYKQMFARNFENWCKMAKRVDVWYYGEAYSSAIPDPNVTVMRENLQYFRDQGCGGVFSLVGSTVWTGLPKYCLSRLSWDCDITLEEYREMIREYFIILYGEESGEDIYNYFIMLEQAGQLVGDSSCLRCSAESKLSFPYYGEHYEKMLGLFADALDHARTFAEYDDIEKISMHVDYIAISDRWESWHENGTAEQKAFIDERYHILYERALKHNYMLHCMPDQYFPGEGMDFTISPVVYGTEPKKKK